MEKIVVIVGQTSSGKSALAVSLAKKFNGEVISADSRQVYRGLDWCSGKVTKEEKQGIAHHLIDVANLGEQFSLYDFQKLAYEEIEDILSRGKLPIIAGGTGLYTRSIVEGYNLSPVPPNQEYRNFLESQSIQNLLSLCKSSGIKLDGEYTRRRLIRELEKNSSNERAQANSPKYKVLQIGLKWERSKIYDRIKVRLEARMPNMLNEIKNLTRAGASVEFLKSLGLEAKMVTEYLEGKFDSYAQFFDELYKQERHFAKRQDTWERAEKNIVWISGEENPELAAAEEVEKFLKNDEK